MDISLVNGSFYFFKKSKRRYIMDGTWYLVYRRGTGSRAITCKTNLTSNDEDGAYEEACAIWRRNKNVNDSYPRLEYETNKVITM